MRGMAWSALLIGLMALVACDGDPAGVPDAPIASVEVTPPAGTLVAGQTVKLTAVPKTADGSVLGGRRIDWLSAAEDVARVSADGMVTAVSPGTAWISATAGGRSGGALVTVVSMPVPVGSITLGPSDADVWVGGSRAWQASVRTASGDVHPNPPALVWTVDDPTVARVDAAGRVYGLQPGTTHVRATADGVQGGAKVTVRTVFAGRQRFFLDATRDADGAPRTVQLGTLTWYGESVEGTPARELLTSGTMTFETVGGVTRYWHQVWFDVVIDGNGGPRKVAFGSISDSGTVVVLDAQDVDGPVLRFDSENPQNADFSARLDAAGRLIVRQLLAAAPMLDYAWVRE